MERGHPVRLSAKREYGLNMIGRGLSVLRTLADRMSALRASTDTCSLLQTYLILRR